MSNYYKMVNSLYDITVPDHLEYGYEFRRDFRHALWMLIDRWRGRTGECIGEKNGFRLLRFHDTPGGKPDEAWLPCCLLESADPPPADEHADEQAEEIMRAFGID
jgi:hypothetical protein